MSAAPLVLVAIPARDEEARIGAALAAVSTAGQGVDVRIAVVVAADACTDRTAAIARGSGALVVETSGRLVGAARRAAVAAGLDAHPHAVWIANTDADSIVPPGWLVPHLDAMAAGVDLLLGSVLPDARELTPQLLSAWRRRNPPIEHHRRVHGANLGVRTALYRRVGGYADIASEEDLDLVRRARAMGADVRSTHREPVITSARRAGRAPGGFSRYLDGLERAIDPPAAG